MGLSSPINTLYDEAISYGVQAGFQNEISKRDLIWCSVFTRRLEFVAILSFQIAPRILLGGQNPPLLFEARGVKAC
jgi:hypothetical protein